MLRVIPKYVDDTFAEFNHPNKTLGFVTHSSATKEIVDVFTEEVKKNFQFDNLYETVAGATVTSHCGENTIGVIYYNDDLQW